jgi:hypothetical protein
MSATVLRLKRAAGPRTFNRRFGRPLHPAGPEIIAVTDLVVLPAGVRLPNAAILVGVCRKLSVHGDGLQRAALMRTVTTTTVHVDCRLQHRRLPRVEAFDAERSSRFFPLACRL